MKKGDWVQFREDWGKQPLIHRVGIIRRLARNGVAVVATQTGVKLVRKPAKNLRVVRWEEIRIARDAG